jgi:hypothetical protein
MTKILEIQKVSINLRCALYPQINLTQSNPIFQVIYLFNFLWLIGLGSFLFLNSNQV